MKILSWLLLSFWFFNALAFAQTVFAAGTWQTIDYAVDGQWQIVKTNDSLTVKLGKDFSTKKGPDLHIVFSPYPVAELTHKNALKGALVLDLLTGPTTGLFRNKIAGPQNINIPKGTNLKQYKSITILCVEYSHLWAGADLP